VDGVGVDERDLEPEEPAARPFVDQLGALGNQLVQRLADIVDLVRDVVHARASLGEEPPDRRLVAERREQLDAAGTDPKGRSLDTLLGNGLAVLELGAEEPLVRLDRLVQIGDRDAEMVDSARLHGRGCYSAATPLR